jgi:hypothetical protein
MREGSGRRFTCRHACVKAHGRVHLHKWLKRPRLSKMTQWHLFAKGSAIISGCGRYRYELRRVWNDGAPPYVVGMLNPSTANADADDPTITRCMRRAATNGFGSLIVWNLGAGRATDPSVWKRMNDPVGPENNSHIRRILLECRDRGGLALVGWGSHGSHLNRDAVAVAISAEIGVTLHCLGVTKGGHPKHPLYVGYSQSLLRWKALIVENSER